VGTGGDPDPAVSGSGRRREEVHGGTADEACDKGVGRLPVDLLGRAVEQQLGLTITASIVGGQKGSDEPGTSRAHEDVDRLSVRSHRAGDEAVVNGIYDLRIAGMCTPHGSLDSDSRRVDQVFPFRPWKPGRDQIFEVQSSVHFWL